MALSDHDGLCSLVCSFCIVVFKSPVGTPDAKDIRRQTGLKNNNKKKNNKELLKIQFLNISVGQCYTNSSLIKYHNDQKKQTSNYYHMTDNYLQTDTNML